MWSWSTNVTDRRTDRRTTCNLNTALCTSASRGKNGKKGLMTLSRPSLVKRSSKRLHDMTISEIDWFLFSWRTILPNFIQIGFETTEIWAFWRALSQHNQEEQQDEYSDMGSVPDPKTIGKMQLSMSCMLRWQQASLVKIGFNSVDAARRPSPPTSLSLWVACLFQSGVCVSKGCAI